MNIYILLFIFKIEYFYKPNSFCHFPGDWGLGIGDWGLGIGDWAQSPIPNPHPFLSKLNVLLKVYYEHH